MIPKSEPGECRTPNANCRGAAGSVNAGRASRKEVRGKGKGRVSMHPTWTATTVTQLALSPWAHVDHMGTLGAKPDKWQ